MGDYSILIFTLLGLLILVGPLTLSIIAMSRTAAIKRLNLPSQNSLNDLARQIAVLRDEVRLIRAQSGSADADEPEGLDEASPDDEVVVEPPTPAAPPPYARPGSRTPEPEPARAAARQSAAPVSASPDTPAVEKQSFEEVLASRWLVWLGAIVIGLGSIFLVKFAIDQGLLGPAVRDSLTFLLGVALILGGEWLRRSPLQRQIASIRPNYVPLALTASGLFAAFASLYAAHAFHGLIGPIPAFAGLAFVAFVAVGLSLLQGKFVALLGLLGAATTPLLIATPNPSLWALLPYLLVIQAACLTLVYYKRWWSLGFGTLTSTLFWPAFIWSQLGFLTDAQVIPLGLYLLIGVSAFFVLRHMFRGSELSVAGQNWVEKLNKRPSNALAWLAALLVALFMFVLVQSAEYSAIAIIVLTAFAVLYLVVGRFTPVLEGIAVAAATTVVVLMGTWPELYWSPETGSVIPVFFLFGGLFGVAGFAALWGAERPALWAGISIAVPLALLVIAYWLVADFNADYRWIGLAVALGAVSLAAATRVVLFREAYGLNISLGLYAAGVVAFVSLAATMFLEQAWLTVALSVQVLALGWIYRQIPERSLEKIALIIAGIVLIRLVVNPSILDYPVDGFWRSTWIVYGYGVPALAFYGAAKYFRDAKATLLVPSLQAGALAFEVLLVSFHIRLFVAGSLDSFSYSLLEQSLHAITWLSIGTALAIRHQRHANLVALYGSRILLLLAAAQIVFFHLLVSNPIQTLAFVGDYPVFNTLFLAYAVPAGFAFFLAKRFQHEKPLWPAMVSAILGVVLVFAYLSLEVRHAYHGPVLSAHQIGDAESYTYSLVWLIYALVLLTIGIVGKATMPRYVSLAVLMITVAKAFLFDMADLEGLLRVSTFLILGLTLIGIGYLYQRFVFRVPTSGPANEAAPVQSGGDA
ncbi:MAG: DUF2339 domain-containing protein [Alphaproteobacteria bacterium]|nr:DUF2339 domain-containing protein [Alphaproteobacteria bacterium]